jgi:anti-anti-sigma factor
MVAGLNAIVWERDPDTLRIRFINRRAEELLGYPTAQWLEDEGLAERIVHPDDYADARDAVGTGIAEGRDFSLSYRVRAADGRWVWLQHLGHVAHDANGAARALHTVLIDVTDAKRRELAAALLAAAGEVLAGPGTVTERLAAVAALTVGDLCDRATVWLRGDDGRYRPVAAAPPEAAPQVLALTPVTAPAPLEEAYRAGRPFIVPQLDEELLRVTASGDEEQYRSLAALGTRRVLVVPLLAEGEVVGLLTLVAVDTDRWSEDSDLALAADLGQRLASMVAGERRAAQRRALQEFTAALSAAGSVDEAAAVVTDGLRRVLGAELVRVSVLAADGLLHSVGTAGHPDDERRAKYDVRRLSDAFPLADAARRRRPVWLHDRAAVLAGYPAVVPDVLEWTQAVAALPLLVGDRAVGALAVTFRTSRRFDADERTFLLTVAGQIGAAFERAALADARREMADTLQRSLLPGDLPAVDRLAVTARYLPAVQGTSAGGDWYDVLPLAGGAVAVAVGDVVGHGAPAAAVMGQLRSALAGLLLAGLSTARALEVLDQFAAQVPGARMSTVACLRLEPDTGRLTYSSAGHPPPLLVGGGGTRRDRYLDGGLGPALGLPAAGSRPEVTLPLPPGATLVLYTDGLVERRGATLDDGLERLATAVTTRRSSPLPALLDGVLDELVDGNGGTDDIAVVAVRPLPAPLRLDLPAEPARLAEVRRAVRWWTSQAALPPDAIEDLLLALGEATGNAVEHAYRNADVPGRVVVELHLDHAGDVVASVTDTGTWRPPPADPGFRGRGLQIISRLAHDVDLSAGPAGSILRFAFTPTAPSRAVSRHGAAAQIPVARRPDEQPATLDVSDAPDRHCLALVGDLDLAGTTAIRELVLAELADPRPITVDLTRLGVVTSVGAGLLLEVADRAAIHGDVDILLPVSGPARRMLDLTGLAAALRPGADSSAAR